MQYIKHLLIVSFCFALLFATHQVAIGGNQPDWQQENALGQDMAISHEGQKWFIGQDGAAYKWNDAQKKWQKHGSRTNFKRIDAGKTGAAAIATNGQIYVTDIKRTTWKPTGIVGQDLSIGGDKIWVAGAKTKKGRGILTANFKTKGKMKWQQIAGDLSAVDVDPNGRPWGVDRQGDIFVYADGNWIADTKAPKATDIGVGGNGALYIVGTDLKNNLGGGSVYQRNGQTGNWAKMPGRLTAITVNELGQAAGVNSRKWLIAGQMKSAPMANQTGANNTNGSNQTDTGDGNNTDTEAGTDDNTDLIDPEKLTLKGELTLADILGNGLPGADKVVLTEVDITEDTIAGTATVNGSPVRAILHQPDREKAVFVAGLEHQSIDLGHYIPKIRQTSLGSFGLGNAVFYIQGENAEPISYETLEDMPAALSGLLGKGDYNGLFPLIIHPGVTVVGTYVPADNNATAVMKAYGLDEKGYAVKGHFKLSQIGNVSFGTYDGSKPQKPTKKELCEFIISPGASGLDLTIPLPDYAPKFAEGSVAFHGSEFSLKEIDGKIEPAILAGMTFKAPETEFGISDITMAGKLSVQGDLNILCNGVDAETEGQISVAAATSYNLSDLSDMAFSALERAAEDGVESPSTDKDIGWKEPFGIPFLNIRHYAVSGTFDQKEEDGAMKRSLDTTIWMQSRVDRAELDVTGKVTYDIEETGLKVDDWSLSVPGPIALNDLPAVKDMPKVDEFAVADIELTPNEMTGTLMRQNKKLNAQLYFGKTKEEDAAADYQFFVAFDSFKPTMIYDFIPEAMADVTLSPALIGWSTKKTHALKYADAAEKLQPLLKTMIDEDGEVTLAEGLFIGGKTTTDQIFGGKLSKLPEKYLSVTDGISMMGTFVANDQGKFTGQVEAALDSFKIKQIPDSLITFTGSKLVLSNLDGNKVEVETTATVKAPEKTDPITMVGKMSYEQESDTKHKLELSLGSKLSWNKPFAIPELSISDLGFEASFERAGDAYDSEIGFTGAGTYREQGGDVSIMLTGNETSLDDLVVTFEGAVTLSKLFDVPNGVSAIADATLRKLFLSKNAVAGDLAFNLENMAFDGRAAVIEDDGKHALFLRQDQKLDIGEIINDMPKPLNDLSIPKGLLIISDQQVIGFDAADIPTAIYEDVIAGLVADETAHSLLVEDGLTFYTEVNIEDIPPLPRAVMKTPFGVSGDIPIGGSVGGLFGNGDPSIGFYTYIKNSTPSFPSFVKEFIDFGKENKVKLFVRSTAGTEGNVQVGIETAAKIKPRRLDKPDIVQPLDATFNLTYTAAVNDLKMTAGAEVVGKWSHPMGLENYHFTDPSFTFGVEEKGTVIEIHTKRAEFIEAGENKAFVFDMASTWAGIVPTDLAIQFAKTKDTDVLTLTPITLARVQKSIFDLAFSSSSNLSVQILGKLNGTAKSTFETFSGKVSDAQNGIFGLIEKSPLSMIAVRNPVVYFGTPGSKPPSNPNIDRPPLGLGVHVAGDVIVDVGSTTIELASGEYKINLLDGYKLYGTVTPPSPFASNYMIVSGNMPLLGGPQHLSLDGSLEVPGVNVVGIPLKIDGRFDVSRGSFTTPEASIYADVSIGDIIGRQAGMQLANKQLTFESPGGCTDLPPIDIKGTIPFNSPDADVITASLLSSFSPMVPDPVECAGDLAGAFKNIAEGTYNAGRAIINDPTGSAENLGKEIGKTFTDPKKAMENAQNLAQLPMNASEALAGAGVAIFKMGAEKVPVLGPSVGAAVGEGFNRAMALKNMAMNKLTNNAVTGWMKDSFGAAAGAVTGALGDAGSAVVGAMFGSDDKPTWFRVSPLRCEPGNHYWNEIFTQCFEHGAIVLFDETTRGTGNMGDCIQTRYVTHNHVSTYVKDALKVAPCAGDGRNQFHLDPVNNWVKAVRKVYYGYHGRFYGPHYEGCLTRRNKTDGLHQQNEVYIDKCSQYNKGQKWAYTPDMKLKNGEHCLTRTADHKLAMGNCTTSHAWLGTAVVPDWNSVEEVPERGQIAHDKTGQCLYWHGGGPYRLAACNKGNPSPDDKYHMRSHTRLRVLNDNHTVSMMGARPWDNEVIYGCMGLNGPGQENVMARHCWPDRVYEESKWQILAVNSNGDIQSPRSAPLKNILSNGRYVFKNIQNGKCLTADQSREDIAAGREAVINKVTDCTNWRGKAKDTIVFRGYAPDGVAQGVFAKKALKEQQAFLAMREKLKPVLLEWLRYRIRAENNRVKELRKSVTAMATDVKAALYTRQSPGACPSGQYWNQSLHRCSKGGRMILAYHGVDGSYEGCLRHDTNSQTGTYIEPNCNIDGDSNYFIDAISFLFDDQGRIIKKNAEYVATAGNVTHRNTGEEYMAWTGTKTVAGEDTCLTINNSVMDVKVPDPDNPNRTRSLKRVGFKYCSDSDHMKWRYAPGGELVYKDGRCVRNAHYVRKVYSIENVRKVDKLLPPIEKNIRDRYKRQYAAQLRQRDIEFNVYKKQLAAQGLYSLAYNDGRVRAEYLRLNEKHGLKTYDQDIANEIKAEEDKLFDQYPAYIPKPVSAMVLDDCKNNPMQAGKYRWVPQIGVNFTAQQELPETAIIKSASNDNLCLTTDMQLYGQVTMANCDVANKNQYYAFGGVDKTRFLIAPRNAKTCLYDAGQGKISHRACQARGLELFMKVETDVADEIKLLSAVTGKCLTTQSGVMEVGQALYQTACDNAPAFKLQAVDDISNITFARMIDLQANPEIDRTWDKYTHRATLLYHGAYLKQGNGQLIKAGNDNAVLSSQIPTAFVDKVISHPDPKTGLPVYIPAVTVPETKIMTLPAMADGVDRVSFVHARPVDMIDPKTQQRKQLTEITDPYIGHFPNWVIYIQHQKVMKANADGNIVFDYIVEDEDFRKAASFKMVPALSGDANKYSFESIAYPGQYIQNDNGNLILGTNTAAASFDFTATTKWLRSDNINIETMAEPLRETKPPFKNWQYPEGSFVFTYK